MNTPKVTQYETYIIEKLVEIGKKLDITESGMQSFKSEINNEMKSFKDEVGQSIRDLGALIEHQSDRITSLGEGVSMVDDKLDRYYLEFKEYAKKQDAINQATWFRVGKLEDRVFGDSEESFGDIAFA